MTDLRISELAHVAGVPVSTLRYYERIGLLRPRARSGNGYRVYDDSSAEHVDFIVRAKGMGIPLEQITELTGLWVTGGCGPLEDRLRALLALRLSKLRSEQSRSRDLERRLLDLLAHLDDADPGDLCRLESACHPSGWQDGFCARLPAAVPAPPPTCSLRIDEQSERIAEWHALLAEGQVVERLELGVRVAFPPTAEMAGRVARLCSAEAVCCSSLRFVIEISAEAVLLIVEGSGGPDTAAVMERLVGPSPELPG